jgi:hypothetical protein
MGAELQAALRNPIGYGEIFKISHLNNAVLDTPEASFQLNFPYLGMNHPGSFAITGRISQDHSQTYFSSYDSKLKSVFIEYETADHKGHFTIECSERQEVPMIYQPHLNHNHADKSTTTSPFHIDGIHLFGGLLFIPTSISYHQSPSSSTTQPTPTNLPSKPFTTPPTSPTINKASDFTSPAVASTSSIATSDSASTGSVGGGEGNGDGSIDQSSFSTPLNNNHHHHHSPSRSLFLKQRRPTTTPLDDLGHPIRTASKVILQSATTSYKLSLKYQQNLLDTRDNKASPSSGSSLDTMIELAIPPGDAQFLKTELQSQWHYPISFSSLLSSLKNIGSNPFSSTSSFDIASSESNRKDQLVFSFAGNVGITWPLAYLFPYFSQLSPTKSTTYTTHTTNTHHPTHSHTNKHNHNQRPPLYPLFKPLHSSYLSDRYFMGGPLFLRGFLPGGIGPRAYSIYNDDSIGGDTKSNLVMMVSYPLHTILQSITTLILPPTIAPTTTTNTLSTIQSIFQSYDCRLFGFIHGGSIGSSSYWLKSIQSSQRHRHNSNSNNNSNSNHFHTPHVPPSLSTTPTTPPRTTRTTHSSHTPHTPHTTTTTSLHPIFGFVRLSVGGGMSLVIANMIRFEINYAIPISYASTDNVKQFQLGVGLTINQ